MVAGRVAGCCAPGTTSVAVGEVAGVEVGDDVVVTRSDGSNRDGSGASGEVCV